jgi:hypothetical protein
MKTAIIVCLFALSLAITLGHQPDDCQLVRYDSITTYNAWHNTNYPDRAELMDATTVINSGNQGFIAEECQ